MVKDAVNPLPQSVCTLYAALQDDVAATARAAPAPPATARPNAASNAAATAAVALRAFLGKSLICRHLHEIAERISRRLRGQ
jgi:hypothetical protein